MTRIPRPRGSLKTVAGQEEVAAGCIIRKSGNHSDELSTMFLRDAVYFCMKRMINEKIMPHIAVSMLPGCIDNDGISALNVAGDVAVKFERQ